RITPFAPSSAAFCRCELIIPLSEVTSLPPFEFSTATSVYGLPTLLVSVNTCTPSGQIGASLSDGFNRAALVETHAARTRTANAILVDMTTSSIPRDTTWNLMHSAARAFLRHRGAGMRQGPCASSACQAVAFGRGRARHVQAAPRASTTPKRRIGHR